MWRRTFYIIAVAGAMAAGVGAAPARAFDFCKDWGMFCPEPPPPPPPVIEITCDKTVVPQGWGQKAWCVTPGKAHPGEVIIVKGKNFPGGTTYNGDVRFFYSDGRRLNSAVGLLMGTPSVSKINDNGTFAVAIIVPSTDMQNQGKPPVGQFRVEVFTFVNCQNVCNQNDPDLKPKEMRARASAQIQIEAGVNPLPLPGGGDFPVTCKWEEWVYDDLGVPQRKDPTSSERCAKGASFTFQHHFPLTLRGEYTRLYLRDSDTSHCQNSELIPEGGDKKACYYVVGNAPAGLVCDPWKGCTGERSDQTEIQHAISLCRAIAPAAGKPKNGLDWRDADCDVMGNGSIGGQLRNDAVYQVAVRSYYNRTQKAEHWWEVASKPFTIFDAPKLGNFQYKTKQFTISFLADRIEHEEAKTGLPIYSKQYLQPGQIVPGYDGFRFFFKVSPPAGETIGPFPKHKIKITDLDPLGQTKDFASGSVEPDKDGVYSVYGGYRVPSPEDEAAIYGVHTYIVQCVDCAQDAFLRDSDPKNSRNGWYVTYPDLRFTAEVIRRNTLPVSKIFLNKTVVKPGDKLEITGKNFSPQTILNEVTFSGYSEKDRPPYNIVLDGWPEGKALWTNVNPDGTFRLVINVPKNAGLHTSKKREDVQVGVAMSLGKSSFREFVKVTLDTSDCPDQTSTISIVKTRDAATDSGIAITAANPFWFGHDRDIIIRGTGFACRAKVAEIAVSWEHNGKKYGPTALKAEGSVGQDIPLTLFQYTNVGYDGTFTQVLSAWNYFFTVNQLRVAALTITLKDTAGNQAGSITVPILPYYRLSLSPPGDYAFEPGEAIPLRLDGFGTGHLVGIVVYDTPLEPGWNTTVHRVFQKAKKLYIERDPDYIDFPLPADVKPGPHTVMAVDITQGLNIRLEDTPRAAQAVKVVGKGEAAEKNKVDDQKKDNPCKNLTGYLRQQCNLAYGLEEDTTKPDSSSCANYSLTFGRCLDEEIKPVEESPFAGKPCVDYVPLYQQKGCLPKQSALPQQRSWISRLSLLLPSPIRALITDLSAGLLARGNNDTLAPVKKFTASTVAGTYRCWSFNVENVGGGKCTSPPLVLKKNGTYTMSKERGTYRLIGDTVILSKSKIRGPGRLNDDPPTIVFKYNYNGREQTMTYLRQGIKAPDDSTGGLEVPLELTLTYDKPDGSLSWINAVSLVPDGESLDKAKYRPDGITIMKDEQTLVASFRKVISGRRYQVYTSSGFEQRLVGAVNMPKVERAPIMVTLVKLVLGVKMVSSSASSGAPAATPISTAAPPVAESATPVVPSPDAPRCNPNLPNYAQPGCRE